MLRAHTALNAPRFAQRPGKTIPLDDSGFIAGVSGGRDDCAIDPPEGHDAGYG
jgi:hypothetical protein